MTARPCEVRVFASSSLVREAFHHKRNTPLRGLSQPVTLGAGERHRGGVRAAELVETPVSTTPAPIPAPNTVVGVICAGDVAVYRDDVKHAIERGIAQRPDAVWVCVEPKSDRMTHDVMISLDIEPVVLPLNDEWRRKAPSEKPPDAGRGGQPQTPTDHSPRTSVAPEAGDTDGGGSAPVLLTEASRAAYDRHTIAGDAALPPLQETASEHADGLSADSPACTHPAQVPKGASPAYDLRRTWRDLEMLTLCDELIVFHKRTGSSPWRDRHASGLHAGRLFVVELGPEVVKKRTRTRKPVGA